MPERDYTVKINGIEIECETARVSAVPFNRRWPGHQRTLDQTELVSFVLFEGKGPFDIEIIPNGEFSSCPVRPLSLGVKPEIRDGVIRFRIDKPQYLTVEPFGRKRALHIFIDEEEDVCLTGNVIRFDSGIHDVGVIELKSNTTLYIAKGATVYGRVFAENAENIKIVGHGILDSSKLKEKILYEVEDTANTQAVPNAERIDTVRLMYCTNVLIDGITVRDSMVYHIRPIACENITVSNVKIIGAWRYNSDGIDTHNCRNMTIHRCFLRTFDDSICVKGWDYVLDPKDMYRDGKKYDIAENFTVSDCVIWNDWGRALEIGAETNAEEIRNIVFKDCDIIHATHNILDVQNVDCADIHGVTFENINIELDDVFEEPALQTAPNEKYVSSNNDYVPILFESKVYFHEEYSSTPEKRGKNRDITVRNIRIFGSHDLIFSFVGYDSEHKSENITIENIYRFGKLLKLPEDIKYTFNEFAEFSFK